MTELGEDVVGDGLDGAGPSCVVVCVVVGDPEEPGGPHVHDAPAHHHLDENLAIAPLRVDNAAAAAAATTTTTTSDDFMNGTLARLDVAVRLHVPGGLDLVADEHVCSEESTAHAPKENSLQRSC